MKTAILLVSLLAVMSCGTRADVGASERTGMRSIQGYEHALNYYSFPDITTLLAAASVVSEEYIKTSDEVATQQDTAAFLLLLTAAQGAYDAVSDASTGRLARVGMLGLTINESAKYLQPVETSAALLKAAERQICVVGAGRRHALGSSTNSSGEFGLIADKLMQIRIMLRQELTRGEFPNYAELADQYAEDFRQESTGADLQKRDPAQREADLRADLSRCLLVAA